MTIAEYLYHAPWLAAFHLALLGYILILVTKNLRRCPECYSDYP